MINFNNYHDENVVAMDETAVYYGTNNQLTIDRIGASSITIPSTGYESLRVTCILAITRSGEKLPPLIMSKGRNTNITVRNSVWILETEKAWSTQEAIRIWIEKVLPLTRINGERGILIWDSASTHRANEMKDYIARKIIDQVMIPSGTTPYLQSLDIAINKPFKDYMKEEINDFINNRQIRNARGNPVKPSFDEIINWVQRSWDQIFPETVINALKSAYIYPNQTFEETYVFRYDRLGHLVRERLLQPSIEPTEITVPEIDDVEIEENI